MSDVAEIVQRLLNEEEVSIAIRIRLKLPDTISVEVEDIGINSLVVENAQLTRPPVERLSGRQRNKQAFYLGYALYLIGDYTNTEIADILHERTGTGTPATISSYAKDWRRMVAADADNIESFELDEFQLYKPWIDKVLAELAGDVPISTTAVDVSSLASELGIDLEDELEGKIIAIEQPGEEV